MKLAITGGGTGGHLAIARAIKEEAVAQSIEVVYFGSTYGQDQKWFAQDRDFSASYFFETSGIVNKRGLKKLWALWAMVKAFFKARRLLKQEGVDRVLSVGGYSAAPASVAALSLRLPYFIHEQNAVTGRLNKMLKPYAKQWFSSYEQPIWDYPVNGIFFEKARLRKEVKTIIFLGGSQGAQFINEWALSLALELTKRGIKIIHQCGDKNLEAMKSRYQTLGVHVTLFGFTMDIISYLDQADFAVARSGASTVWELTALQLPALFVPFPYAAGDHQTANARSHVDNHASWMMQQHQKSDEKLWEILDKGVASASQKLGMMIKAGGAKRILESVMA